MIGFSHRGLRQHQNTCRSPSLSSKILVSFSPFIFHYWFIMDKKKSHKIIAKPNQRERKKKKKHSKGRLKTKKHIKVRSALLQLSRNDQIKYLIPSAYSWKMKTITQGLFIALYFLIPHPPFRNLIPAQWWWVSRGANYLNSELLGTGMKNQLQGHYFHF